MGGITNRAEILKRLEQKKKKKVVLITKLEDYFKKGHNPFLMSSLCAAFRSLKIILSFLRKENTGWGIKRSGQVSFS